MLVSKPSAVSGETRDGSSLSTLPVLPCSSPSLVQETITAKDSAKPKNVFTVIVSVLIFECKVSFHSAGRSFVLFASL